MLEWQLLLAPLAPPCSRWWLMLTPLTLLAPVECSLRWMRLSSGAVLKARRTNPPVRLGPSVLLVVRLVAATARFVVPMTVPPSSTATASAFFHRTLVRQRGLDPLIGLLGLLLLPRPAGRFVVPWMGVIVPVMVPVMMLVIPLVASSLGAPLGLLRRLRVPVMVVLITPLMVLMAKFVGLVVGLVVPRIGLDVGPRRVLSVPVMVVVMALLTLPPAILALLRLLLGNPLRNLLRPAQTDRNASWPVPSTVPLVPTMV